MKPRKDPFDPKTLAFLKCVFPEAVSREECLLLMHVLYDIGDMSMRAVADAAGILMNADYIEYLHDMYFVASHRYVVDQEKAAILRERLYACGYETWIES